MASTSFTASASSTNQKASTVRGNTNAFDFFKRERWSVQRRVNFTFANREDGSMTAISRRGFAWVSPAGLTEWHQVSQDSNYPQVEGIFEDPLLWKDNVQYHLIANDWKGRIAYYLRSKDGVHWKPEPGEAYSPGIVRYQDGTASQWYNTNASAFCKTNTAEQRRPILRSSTVTSIPTNPTTSTARSTSAYR